jgi:tetratricopeptide (TPR) repeat protein
LAYDLGQACLYTFLNAPERKTYMDGRLEMPDLATFEKYRDIEKWLHDANPRWESALQSLGNPLVLLTHLQNFRGESILLTHPNWRCVYFDALAAIFVPHSNSDQMFVSPDVDFAARHFRHANDPSVPNQVGAAFREMQALFNLGVVLRQTAQSDARLRTAILLCALDRGERAVIEESSRSGAWAVLGTTYWNLAAGNTQPPRASTAWDPAAILPYAQTTYCLRRALELAPDNPSTLRYLYESYRGRRMFDSQYEVGKRLLSHGLASEPQRKQIESLERRLDGQRVDPGVTDKDPIAGFSALLSADRPEAAVRLAEGGVNHIDQAWPWPAADRLAATYMQLGRPADARRVWTMATKAPPAVQASRLATTYWVERDFDEAVRLYREALKEDAHLAEAWWGLAALYGELGDAKRALHACQESARLDLSEPQRTNLNLLQSLAQRADKN